MWFQETYFLYNRREIIQETLGMKLIQPILVALQLSELICYIYLFSYIAKHDKEMEENKIISLDNFKNRKQMNLFSLNAQIFGSVLEIVYQLIILIVRLLGSKFFPQYSDSIRGYVDSFFITQFPLTSLLQILVTPDLRRSFFALVKHWMWENSNVLCYELRMLQDK